MNGVLCMGSDEIPALLLSGGRPRDPAAMAGMIAVAFDRIDKPAVAYIGTANGDSPAFFEAMEATLKQAGAYEVLFLRLADDHADIDAAKDSLSGADVVFLAGGEVEDGMVWLDKHGLSSFLRDLYTQGKRFIGVSAGTIMMGTHWTHWDVQEDDSTASLFDCLGIIPCLFDVHGEDEDWVELKTTLRLLGEGSIGYALPAGAMISADSGGILMDIEKKHLIFQNNNGVVGMIS